MRKLAGTLLAVVIAVAGFIGLIAFFNARDDSTTNATTTRAGPRPLPDRAGDAAVLADGNVVLRYADRSFTPALRKLAGDLGAPDTPELRRAGQAVILRRIAGAGGVQARAYGHDLAVATPSDPALQGFIEQWLGQGASG